MWTHRYKLPCGAVAVGVHITRVFEKNSQGPEGADYSQRASRKRKRETRAGVPNPNADQYQSMVC